MQKTLTVATCQPTYDCENGKPDCVCGWYPNPCINGDLFTINPSLRQQCFGQ